MLFPIFQKSFHCCLRSSFSVAVFGHGPFLFFMAVKYGPSLLTSEKRIQAFKPKCLRKLFRISYLARSTSLWVHRNLFWQWSRVGNLHGLGMSHTMTASPKPSFGALWRVGNTMVSRRNARWTKSKSDTPAHARTAHKGLLQKRLEEGLC